MSQILQSYYFLESPATWEVDNTVVTVMALMVCLALSHQRGATVVPTSHRRKPRQGKEMQSLLLWRSVFCALPLHVQSCTETQVHTQVGIIHTLGHTRGCSCHTQIPTCTHMQDDSYPQACPREPHAHICKYAPWPYTFGLTS